MDEAQLARENLEQVLKDHGTDKASASRALGLNHAYFQQYVKRHSPRRLPEEVRDGLKALFGVTDDVLLGRESYDPRDSTPAALPQMQAPRLDDGMVEISGVDFASIQRFDAALSAGPGSIVELNAEPLGRHLMERQWLAAVTRAAPDHLAILKVDGDSMDPTLNDGDWVLVDRSQRRINREGVYALQIGDACWVKRISLNLRERLVQVISDNPVYPLQELPEEDLAVIGRIVWIVGRAV